MSAPNDVTWRDVLFILLIAAVSRAWYAWLGVTFDASPLYNFLQFIDIDLLRERLVESLIFYHAKAPLVNAFAGVGLKLLGEQAPLLYAAVYHVLGLVILVSVFGLVAGLTALRPLGWCVTTLIAFSPAFVLYENWFMYTLPACAFLTLSGWLMLNYLRTDATPWAAGLFACLALLVLTRGIFHFFWLVGVVAMLLLVARVSRKRMVTWALVPLLIGFAWYGKNWQLFGTFSSGTLMGLGLSNVSTRLVTHAELGPLVEQGRLSELAMVSRYEAIPNIVGHQKMAEDTGIPVLDRNLQLDGQVNYNSQDVRLLSQVYLRDALTVIRHFPGDYLVGVGIAHLIFFSPATVNTYLPAENREAMGPMTWFYYPLVYGAPIRPGLIEEPYFGFPGKLYVEVNTGWLLVLVYLVVIGFGLLHATRTVFRADWTPENIVIGYLFANVMLVYLAAVLLELAENNRYRWLSEPFLWVLVAVIASRFVKWWQARR